MIVVGFVKVIQAAVGQGETLLLTQQKRFTLDLSMTDISFTTRARILRETADVTEIYLFIWTIFCGSQSISRFKRLSIATASLLQSIANEYKDEFFVHFIEPITLPQDLLLIFGYSSESVAAEKSFRAVHVSTSYRELWNLRKQNLGSRVQSWSLWRNLDSKSIKSAIDSIHPSSKRKSESFNVLRGRFFTERKQ